MSDDSPDHLTATDGEPPSNDGNRLDQLPRSAAERVVPGRITRAELIEWWETRFGVPAETFERFSFWEKGAGKIWVYAGEASDPSDIEALGMLLMRTRQDHWKPTSRAAQRFGGLATKNVISIDGEVAARFVDGTDQELAWDGDWGYLLVTHDLAGEVVPIGVGLYLYGELRSVIPKGSRRDLSPD
ncbi:MAG: hypothetical protein A07HR60_00832 [uncultured archaeon A07HR60]|jgi:hypothetical protein|nr:MAG: hypothetical protein J07HR59_01293 [Halorubrum sp. J07HR59]ESS12288.1 MAG: hypothetical protein A07HR60_00832 [uncultured archaeon A07HR60]